MQIFTIMKRILLLLAFVLSLGTAFSEIKYVFYFIGDGMGPNQVLITEMYRSAVDGVAIGRRPLNMSLLPVSGMATTFSRSNGITDSSAAGTALATGSKTNNGTLGIDADGDTLTSVAEFLHDKGWGIGIMTSVSIDHATPASFYAHVLARSDYYQIGQQLCESGFDFFGGAGFQQPQGKDGSAPVNLYELAAKHDYMVARGVREARRMLSDAERLILIQPTDAPTGKESSYNLPYVLDRREGDMSLPEITATGIEYLSKRHDRFFMMVEGGMIDYAGHGQDGASVIAETQEFDDAIGEALRFYKQHPKETLIIVTADHETGGMVPGNSDYTLNLSILQHQRCSSWELSDKVAALYKGNKPSWQDVKSIFREWLGLYSEISISEEEDAQLQAIYKQTLKHKDKDVHTLYKDLNALSGAAVGLLNKKAKVGWTSFSHTATAVPVFAIGVNAQLFTGWMDNTDIPKRILKACE